MKYALHSLLLLAYLSCPPFLLAVEPNFHHLDDYSNPYYPHTHFPKLTTPQWIGEEGVDAEASPRHPEDVEIERRQADDRE